jgi:hypothetical protein
VADIAFAPGSEYLCGVSITLADDAPLAVGASPWRNRRISDIVGGRFTGPRLRGIVRDSGADWSESGTAADGGIATALDVRSLWQTDDGALIYVTYRGRLVIPAGRVAAFRDPAALEAMDPGDYYFRICPLFETSARSYAWLNEIVAIGVGRRTADGVIYHVYGLT